MSNKNDLVEINRGLLVTLGRDVWKLEADVRALRAENALLKEMVQLLKGGKDIWKNHNNNNSNLPF